MSWLVDTNVISELSRRTPNPKVSQWLTARQDELFLSVLTLGELEKGLVTCVEPTRRARLERWLRHEVVGWFGGRLLAIDQAVACRWGRLAGSLKDPVPAIDSLLAATALTHNLMLATRNVADFRGTGVELVNPWD